MPVYRTSPETSLDDLVAQIHDRGEKIVASDRAEGEWVLITEYPNERQSGQIETRSA